MNADFTTRLNSMLDRINRVTTPYSAAIYLAYHHNPARKAADTLHATVATGDVAAVFQVIPWVEKTVVDWHIDRAVDWVMILRHGDRYEPEYDTPPEMNEELFGSETAH